MVGAFYFFKKKLQTLFGMHIKNLIGVAIVIILSANIGLAQKGFLRGKISDQEMGDPLIMANVVEKGTTNGVTSDFDGNYSLTLDPGKHIIEFSFIGYDTKVVKDVEIKPGDVTTLDISLKTSSAALDEVVVTAGQARNTEMALLTVKKKSANMVDGISSQSFRKVGDADLGASIKRVTGVSVEGGKYVYVRGLGDRYTKTILNGMAIPGLDPDKNAVQMDIFPTSVLENVVVYKTFSPDLYGDFTGGIVDVQTKDFPTSKSTSLSLGFTYAPSMHFNNNFLSYDGGSFDFVGYDDGTRALPFPESTDIPDESRNDPRLEEYTKAFSKTMAAKKMPSFMNTSLSLSTGNQINKGNYTFGYNAVINYRNQYEFYENAEFGEYFKDPDKSVYDLRTESVRKGPIGTQDRLWSGLLSLALKKGKSSYSNIFLHTQNGISSATSRINKNVNQNVSTLEENILTYTQRSITNNTTIGKHNLGDDKTLEWANSFSYSRIYDPDFRVTKISVRESGLSLNGGDGSGINRFFRDLKEINESVKGDLTLPIKSMKKSKIKTGLSYTFKRRDFSVLNYNFYVTSGYPLDSDPDYYFRDENIWDATSQSGTYVKGNYEPANSFTASQHVLGVYGMSEMQFTSRFRAIYGLRFEKNMMYYTGQNNSGTEIYDNENTLDANNFLPSLNLVYALNEDANLRVSYNRTLARPTFIEKSISQIYDPITGRTFLGNIDLKQTNINNFDARWEWFFSPNEVFSISGFYKTFDGHIEKVSLPTAPDQVKPRNSGSSWVYGAEFEARKNFGFITSSLKNLSIGANVSIIRSFVDLKTIKVSDDKTEYELRKDNLRDGETLAKTRQMTGQSPYLVNAYLNYQNDKALLNVSLAYNVQGESLFIVGSGLVPDTYLEPFHSLNLNIYKDFGVKKNIRITASIQNILNDETKQVYKSYKAADKIYAVYKPGLSFGLKLGYTF